MSEKFLVAVEKKSTAHKISQIELCAALAGLLDKKFKIKNVTSRQMNSIIKSADLICEAMNREDIKAPAGCGIRVWLQSDEVGASSLVMYRTLLRSAGLFPFQPHAFETQPGFNRKAHPCDPQDLYRCKVLLAAEPLLIPHLAEMKAVSPTWALYIEFWDRLMEMYQAEIPSGEAPMLFRAMERLQAAVVAGEESIALIRTNGL